MSEGTILKGTEVRVRASGAVSINVKCTSGTVCMAMCSACRVWQRCRIGTSYFKIFMKFKVPNCNVYVQNAVSDIYTDFSTDADW